jgi:hypothetical protein
MNQRTETLQREPKDFGERPKMVGKQPKKLGRIKCAYVKNGSAHLYGLGYSLSISPL